MPARTARKKDEPAHWRKRLTISVPPDVATEIEKAAKADNRSVSNYLVQLFLERRRRA